MNSYREDNSSFMMYKEWEELFESLDNTEEAGELIMALFAFAKRGEIAEFKGALKMAFIIMTKQLDRDGKKWERNRQKNIENGRKGGRPRKVVENSDENEKPKKTERFPEKPNKNFTQNKKKNSSEFEGAKPYNFAKLEEIIGAFNNNTQT
jgi:hypothetical protein